MLTVTNSTISGNLASYYGGGICSGGTLTVTSSTISGNSASSSGGGIYNYANDATVMNSTISENSSTSYGGGIYDRDNTLTVISSTISGNVTSGDGGGIYYHRATSTITVTVTDCTISANSASSGGGVYNNGCTLTITDCTISASSGGEIYNNDGTLTITDCTILASSGVGIRNYGNATMTSSMILENSGGGIYNGHGSTLTITSTMISGNSASSSGGGIYNVGTLTVTNSTISGNSTSSSGGGIYNGGTLTITSTTVSENSSSIGGGGGIYSGGTLTVTSSTISGNSASSSGGGIYNYVGTLTVTNSTISGNSTSSSGGGIYNDSSIYSNGATLTMTGSTISGNSASNGGGIYNNSYGTLTVTSSTISGNSASSDGGGGGIYDRGSTLTVISSTISGNFASSGGGIYIGSSGTLTLNNTIVAKNSDDIYRSSGTLSGSNNLIGDGTGQTSFTNGVNGNIVGTAANPIDPMLGELTQAPNGQWCLPLLSDSPAIDAGSNALVPDGTATDVLGNARIQNGQVDIGAVEGVPFQVRSGVTYIVTSLEDVIDPNDGKLTFREAFEAANSNIAVGDAPAGSFTEKDTIRFAEGLEGTFYLEGKELAIIGSLDIIGSGTDRLIFDAQSLSRVFTVTAGIAVGLSNMTITGGKAASNDGGGIYNSGYGTLTVTSSTISGNYGNGIHNNSGTLTVTNSTISGNSGYGIYSGGTLTVTSSTISGNLGSGIYSYNGTSTVTSSTISGNSGYGISTYYGALVLNNTIVAKNSLTDIYNYPRVLPSFGFNNLIGDGTGQILFANGVNGNIVGTAENPIDPMLGEWTQAPNGQWYLPLLSGSPAIDAGSNAFIPDDITTDILGNARIQNGQVDIGAVEGVPFQARPGVTYIVTSLEDVIDPNDGKLTFREAFEAANTNTAIGNAPAGSFTEKDTIRFAEGLEGTFYLGGKELTIFGSLDIIGSRADRLIFDAQSLSRVFTVAAGIAVGLSNMTITGGKAASNDGGGIYNGGTLTVASSTISGNSASYYGGGIYNNNYGLLTVTSSTISGNSASYYGGGIYNNNYSLLTVTSSTISGNSASSYYGGGIYNNDYGTLTVTSSTISGNSAYDGGGIYSKGGTIAVFDSTITRNLANPRAGSGGGICGSRDSMITIMNSTISTNSAGGSGGGIGSSGTVIITNSTITGNSSTGDFSGVGGGIGCFQGGTAIVTNSTIFENSAIDGGGIYNSGTLTVTNSTIYGNSASYGGGLYNGIYGSCMLTVTNSTISGNFASSSSGGGGIYKNNGTLALNNTIVAKNSTDISGGGSGSYNFIGDGAGTSLVNGANGNIVGTAANPIDPLFVAIPAVIDGSTTGENYDPEYWDLRLQANSPTIDKGSNALAVDADGLPLTTDLYGNPRITGETVDIGAYEYIVTLVAPDNLRVADTESDKLGVTWGAVPNASGYIVEYATNAAFTTGLGSKTVTTNSATLDGLAENTTYYVKVMATGAGAYCDSEWSDVLQAKTDVLIVEKPVQQISAETNLALATPGATVTLNVSHTILDRELNETAAPTGVGLYIEYDSTYLEFVGRTYAYDEEAGGSLALFDDEENGCIFVAWNTLKDWGEGDEAFLLLSLNFKVKANAPVGVATFNVNVTAGTFNNAFIGRGAEGVAVEITQATLDIDDNGEVTTDDVNMLLYYIAYAGNLTNSRIGHLIDPAGARVEASDIQSYIENNYLSHFDLDGNGAVTTDDVNMLLYYIAYSGRVTDARIGHLIDPAGARTTAAEIDAFINSVWPSSVLSNLQISLNLNAIAFSAFGFAMPMMEQQTFGALELEQQTSLGLTQQIDANTNLTTANPGSTITLNVTHAVINRELGETATPTGIGLYIEYDPEYVELIGRTYTYDDGASGSLTLYDDEETGCIFVAWNTLKDWSEGDDEFPLLTLEFIVKADAPEGDTKFGVEVTKGTFNHAFAGVGPEDIIVTIEAAITPPVAPTAPVAEILSSNEILVSWQAAEGADRYKVYRSLTESEGFVLMTTTAALFFKDSGLAAGTTYYYRVFAYNTETELESSDYVFIDAATPGYSHILAIDFNGTGTGFDITFSEPMDIARKISDGSIVSHLEISNSITGPLQLAPSQFSYSEETYTLTWNAGSLLPPGNYDIVFNSNEFQNLEKGTLSGGSGVNLPVQSILGDTEADAFEFTFAVNNPVPIIRHGRLTVQEGCSTFLSGLESYDYYEKGLEYLWDLDGDGIYETEGASFWYSTIGIDGKPGSNATVGLKVKNEFGYESDPIDVIFEIIDLMPCYNVQAPAVEELVAGNSASWTFYAVDIPEDPIQKWVINWGDGSEEALFEGIDLAQVNVVHAFEQAGIYRITARTTDDDGVESNVTLGYYAVTEALSDLFSNDIFSPVNTPDASIMEESKASISVRTEDFSDSYIAYENVSGLRNEASGEPVADLTNFDSTLFADSPVQEPSITQWKQTNLNFGTVLEESNRRILMIDPKAAFVLKNPGNFDVLDVVFSEESFDFAPLDLFNEIGEQPNEDLTEFEFEEDLLAVLNM